MQEWGKGGMKRLKGKKSPIPEFVGSHLDWLFAREGPKAGELKGR